MAYDSPLRVDMPEEMCPVGFADDVVIFISARTIDVAQEKLSRAPQAAVLGAPMGTAESGVCF